MSALRQQLTLLKINMIAVIHDNEFRNESEEMKQAYLTGLRKLVDLEHALENLKTLLDKDYDAKQRKLNVSKD